MLRSRDIDFSRQQFAFCISELEEMTTDNCTLKQILVDISIVTARQINDWGYNDVMLRGRAT